VVAIILVAVFIVSGCTSSSTDSTESAPSQESSEQPKGASPSPEPTSPQHTEVVAPTSYWDIVEGFDATTPVICDNYEEVIAKYEAAAEKRINAMRGKLKDAYVASSFKRGKGWLKDDFNDYLETAIQRTAVKALNSISGGRAEELADLVAYRGDSLQLCRLADRYTSTKLSVNKAQGSAEKVVAKAATRPWYSKGYSEYTDGLAYKYTTFSGGDPCGYSECRYAKVTVESRDGCYSGLFGEVNFLDDSGNTRDWDIDSVNAIYPDDRETLVFISYSVRGPGKVQLRSLSCY